MGSQPLPAVPATAPSSPPTTASPPSITTSGTSDGWVTSSASGTAWSSSAVPGGIRTPCASFALRPTPPLSSHVQYRDNQIMWPLGTVTCCFLRLLSIPKCTVFQRRNSQMHYFYAMHSEVQNAFCKFEFPAFLPPTNLRFSPDGTCVTDLSKVFFAGPCISKMIIGKSLQLLVGCCEKNVVKFYHWKEIKKMKLSIVAGETPAYPAPSQWQKLCRGLMNLTRQGLDLA